MDDFQGAADEEAVEDDGEGEEGREVDRELLKEEGKEEDEDEESSGEDEEGEDEESGEEGGDDEGDEGIGGAEVKIEEGEETKEEEIPFKIDVPQNQNSFRELIENKTLKGRLTIIDRIMVCNHYSLNRALNVPKMKVIFQPTLVHINTADNTFL